MTKFAAHGWNTTKTETGFAWRVYGVLDCAGTITLQQGVCTTRAKALTFARRWVGRYRRSAQATAA